MKFRLQHLAWPFAAAALLTVVVLVLREALTWANEITNPKQREYFFEFSLLSAVAFDRENALKLLANSKISEAKKLELIERLK